MNSLYFLSLIIHLIIPSITNHVSIPFKFKTYERKYISYKTKNF